MGEDSRPGSSLDLHYGCKLESRHVLTEKLVEGARLLGISLSHTQQITLFTYLNYFIKWNKVYNLTAVYEPGQMLVQHILDCLSIVPALTSHIHPPASVLDVGSGGGLPGIVLAVAQADWQVSLNDKTHKKTAFLTYLKSTLPLPNIHIVTGRIESLPFHLRFDGVVCRAFAKLSDLVIFTRHLVVPGASIWAMKGVFPTLELEDLQKIMRKGEKIVQVIKLTVPFLDAQRHLVQIRIQ